LMTSAPISARISPVNGAATLCPVPPPPAPGKAGRVAGGLERGRHGRALSNPMHENVMYVHLKQCTDKPALTWLNLSAGLRSLRHCTPHAPNRHALLALPPARPNALWLPMARSTSSSTSSCAPPSRTGSTRAQQLSH
jgi:hypothetical protein